MKADILVDGCGAGRKFKVSSCVGFGRSIGAVDAVGGGAERRTVHFHSLQTERWFGNNVHYNTGATISILKMAGTLSHSNKTEFHLILCLFFHL